MRPLADSPPGKDERKAGRDHNKNAFCTWTAGAAVQGGTTNVPSRCAGTTQRMTKDGMTKE
jgi:hypothetical protein